MQIYTTKLPVIKNLTKDQFVQLVVDCYKGSPHYTIPGLEWDGKSRNIRFGDDRISLQIEELRYHNIIAIRFRNYDKNEIIWTTDHVLNFNEMRMTVRLDRMTTENTTGYIPNFKAPHIVSMMVNNGYIEKDYDLEINSEYIEIDEDNWKLAANIILGRTKYNLPVVIVTKTPAGNIPVNIRNLARRLQGVAHVLLIKTKSAADKLRDNCENKNPYFGRIGCFYPNLYENGRMFNSQNYVGKTNLLESKIVKYVYGYMNQLVRKPLYTWEGVIGELYKLKYESNRSERLDAETGKRVYKEVAEEHEETIMKLSRELKDSANEIAALKAEVQGLHSKYDETDSVPLIYYGKEKDFYEREIREFVLDILFQEKQRIKKKTRRYDILNDIIDANEFLGLIKKRKNEIKKVCMDINKMKGSTEQKLKELGLIRTSDNSHYKYLYYKDPRYCITIAKTGSDVRNAGNTASDIIEVTL